jgi:hypothetical protein
MKKLLTIAMLFATCAIFAQTSFSIGAGVFEQSGIIGVSLGMQTEVNHEFTRNFGVTGDFTYAKLQDGDGREVYLMGGLIDTPDGSTFNQASMLVTYKIFTYDERMAIRIGAGGAYQNWEDIYPTAQLDLIAFADANFYPYLSWQPVFRGGFGEGDGWSHTVTLNLAIKI